MAKAKSLFRCQNCAATFPKWMGQCGECGSWNTLVEEIAPAEETTRRLKTNNSLSEDEINTTFTVQMLLVLFGVIPIFNSD